MAEDSASEFTDEKTSSSGISPSTGLNIETDQTVTSSTSQLFINITEPGQSSRRQTKRAIRSHVARISRPQNTTEANSEGSIRKVKKRKNQTYLLRIHDPTSDVAEVLEAKRRSSSAEDSSVGSSTSGLLTPLSGSNASIPAAYSPIYNKLYVPLILDNYLENLALPIPEVDGTGPVASLRTLWFPVILHNPTIFHVIVLFSASHYVAQNPKSGATHLPTILYLKQCALQSIAWLAASSPEVPGDELIAAAAKLASYEAIFGEKDAFNIHMQTVKRMVYQRGGLTRLGLNGFLARLLLFIDTNSAHLLGTHLYLDESSLPLREPFRPNLDRFVGAPIRPMLTQTPEAQGQD